ncbi:MAG: type II secretion system F family protein [Candidatus Nanoarchaeia archaeon]|nr:type II secretion system F family protein [Candidatus Nanoarchaeia archaeon]
MDYKSYIEGAGFKSIDEFFKKFIMPSSVAIFLLVLVLMIFLKINPLFHFLILIALLGLTFSYPLLKFEKKKVNIDEKIHYFITYAGTISTMGVDITALFKKIAQQKTFDEIAKTFNKMVYLARKWNFGYSKTLHTVSKFVPSKIFGNFIDRLAISIDFGENLSSFLENEQEAVMSDYTTRYKENLEKIKSLQEIMTSMVMALSFLLSISLMMPIIFGTPSEGIMQKIFVFLVFVDLILLAVVKFFIPSDYLCHNLKKKSNERKSVQKYARIIFPISITLFIFLYYIFKFEFILSFVISIFPLLMIGKKAQDEDKAINERDKIYPQFIRSLGAATEVKKGDVSEATFSLLIHDFEILNENIKSFYRRLKLGNEKMKCWYHFEAETGSNLIQNFSQIFAESIILGGSGDKIGEIISKNFQKLNSLRTLRLQLVGGLRGALYGALVGFVITASVSLAIVGLLSDVFTSAMNEAQDSGATGMLNSILSVDETGMDMQISKFYLSLMVIVHSLISAMVLKEGDGGSFWGILYDFVIMTTIGAVIILVIPIAMGSMFSNSGTEVIEFFRVLI